MTKEAARAKLNNFFKDLPMITFSIKEYPGGEWVAQCNEVDSIITTGLGQDLKQMEDLLQDAILVAAGIPKEHATGLLKRVWGGSDVTIPLKTEIDTNSFLRLFPSTYVLDQKYAGMGKV